MTWLAWVVLLPLVATIDLNKLNLANRFSDHHHSYDEYFDDYDNSFHHRLQQAQSCKPEFLNTIINMVVMVMIVVVIKYKTKVLITTAFRMRIIKH